MPVGNVTIGKDTPVFVDTSAPGVGDMKARVGSSLSLNSADSLTNWSIVSGSGELSLEQSDVFEGSGAVKFTPSAVGEHVLKFTMSPAKDLTNYHGICFAVKKVQPLGALLGVQVKVSITDDGGERGPDSYTLVSRDYALRWFNISSVGGGGSGGGGGGGFTAVQKDVVTEVKFTIDVFDSYNGWILIDNVVAQTWSKPQIAYPERTATLSPPYLHTYAGSGVGHNENIPRAGTIKAVLVQRRASGYQTTLALSQGESFNITNGSRDTDAVTAFGDGYVTLGTNAIVNNSGDNYAMIVYFEDED